MKKLLLLSIVLILISGCSSLNCTSNTLNNPLPEEGQWRGVHFLSPGKGGLDNLKNVIAQKLPELGINIVILEVGYGYQYKSHPELWDDNPNALSKEDVRNLVELCRANGIVLMPEINCLGHQSWAKKTGELLTQHPEFDETPQIPYDNPDIYCRSWCPLHPGVNEVIFALFDELIEAFDPPAFHVGMDEVFLIAEDQCERCQGKSPAELYAKAVNDYHDYLVDKRGLTMMMWGDRLLDAEKMGYSSWEAAGKDKFTAPAIDMIPKDIVICDWHYGVQEEYRSVVYFQEQGFRVWPSSWRPPQAALALYEYSRENATNLMMGHLFTTWYQDEVLQELLGQQVVEEKANQVKNVVKAMYQTVKAMEGKK